MLPEEAQPWLAWLRFVSYPPISKDETQIRLARVTSTQESKASPASPAPLNIVVSTVSLGEAPPYEALSYAWLANWHLPLRDVIINDKPSQLPVNLHFFLQQRLSQCEDVALWVDALCINQLDDEEKLEQIALMPDIYGSCTIFTIWLGMGSDDTDKFFASLQESSFSASSPPLHCGDVFRRPWWSRLWVVQEVAFGASSHNLRLARVICGTSSIPWPTLVVALSKLKRDPSDGLVQSLESARARVAMWETKRKTGQTKRILEDTSALTLDDIEIVEQHRTFLQLYHENRFRKCSDARDRILALLSMVAPNKTYFDAVPAASAPPEEIYHSLVLRVDKADRCVEARRLATNDSTGFLFEPYHSDEARSSLYNRISLYWGCPELSNSSSTTMLPRQDYQRGSDGTRLFAFSEDCSRMTVRGVILDQIDQVLSLGDVSSGKNLFSIRETYSDALRRIHHTPTRSQRLLFWRAMFLNNLDFDGDCADNRLHPEDLLSLGETRWFSETSQEYREEYCYRGLCSDCDCCIGNLLDDTDGHVDYNQNPFHPSARPRLTTKTAEMIKYTLTAEYSLCISRTCIPVISVVSNVAQYFQSESDVLDYQTVQSPTHLAILAGVPTPVLLGKLPNRDCYCIVGMAFLPHGVFGLDRLEMGEEGPLMDIALLARTCARKH